MEEKITVLDSGGQLAQLSMNELPDIISGQTQQMDDYSKKIEAAFAKANSAKAVANDARNRSAGLGKKKVAIEALQLAEFELAEAVVSEAEAQQVALECIVKLGENSRFLFGLGVSNLALNRTVVRELELKLGGASALKLTDLAKQETLNVIRQLKAQEDILMKQEELDKKIKIVHGENVNQDKKLESLSKKIIVAYVIGGAGALVGVISLLMRIVFN